MLVTSGQESRTYRRHGVRGGRSGAPSRDGSRENLLPLGNKPILTVQSQDGVSHPGTVIFFVCVFSFG